MVILINQDLVIAADAIKPAHRLTKETTNAMAHLTRRPPPKIVRQPQSRTAKVFADNHEVSIRSVKPASQPVLNRDVVSQSEMAYRSTYPPVLRVGSMTGTIKDSAGNRSGTSAGRGVGPGSRSCTGGGSSNGNAEPHLICAPIPSIPDDLRDEVMQATAVVRFHVRSGGEATVALVTSTDYSERDELILDTLREWRFAPAVRNGVKIDSDAELRLLVSVQ
jgi:periplasmic protein TonB